MGVKLWAWISLAEPAESFYPPVCRNSFWTKLFLPWTPCVLQCDIPGEPLAQALGSVAIALLCCYLPFLADNFWGSHYFMLPVDAQNLVKLFPIVFGTCFQPLSSPAALSDNTPPQQVPWGSSVSRLPVVFVFLVLLIPRHVFMYYELFSRKRPNCLNFAFISNELFRGEIRLLC